LFKAIFGKQLSEQRCEPTGIFEDLPSTVRYQVFISYSQSADGTLAPALQNSLKRFAKPWLGRSKIRVFRDDTSLNVTPQLWPSIEAAINDAEYFLLLASPQAARSDWVQKEVNCWLQSDPKAERLLIVITEGTIEWDNHQNDFDWEITDALPELLTGIFAHEPLYGDLSWAKSQNHLTMRHADFANEVASLSSAILGTPKDELFGKDISEQRKRKWTVITVIMALIGLTLWSFSSEYRTNQQRIRSLAGKLAAQSSLIRTDQPNRIELAALLAVESQRLAPSTEGYQALKSSADLLSDHVVDLKAIDQPLSAGFTSDGKLLAAGSAKGEAVVWETQNWQEMARIRHGSSVHAVAFDNDGEQLATAGAGGRACVWKMPSGEKRVCVEHGAQLLAVDIRADGAQLLTASGDVPSHSTDDYCVRLWNLETAAALDSLCHDKAIVEAFYLSDGEHVVTSSKDGSVRMWDTKTGSELIRLKAPSKDVLEQPIAMALSRQERYLAVATWGGVIVWDTLLLEKIFETRSSGGNVSVSLRDRLEDSTGFVLAGNASGNVRVWRLDNGEEVVTKLPFNTVKVAANPTHDYFAAGTDHGIISLWQYLFHPTLRSRIPTSGSDSVTVLSFDPTGEYLLCGTRYGRLRVWRGWKSKRNTVIETKKKIVDFSLHAQKPQLVTGSGNQAILWDYGASPPFEIRHFTHPGKITAVGLSAKGLWLLTAGVDPDSKSNVQPTSTARLWDARTGTVRTTIRLPTTPTAITFDPLSRYFAIGTDKGELLIQGSETGKRINQFKLDRPILEVNISRNGRYLAVRHPKGPLSVLNTTDWSNTPLLVGDKEEQIASFAFHPKSEAVLVGTIRGTKVWRIKDQQLIKHYPGGLITSIDISEDGLLFMTEGDEEARGLPVTVPKLKKYPSGEEILKISGIPLGRRFQFTLNDNQVVYITYGEGLVVVPWKSRDLIHQTCSRITRTLTRAEWQQYLPGEAFKSTCATVGAK
jgi:WD40 repeat protein